MKSSSNQLLVTILCCIHLSTTLAFLSWKTRYTPAASHIDKCQSHNYDFVRLFASTPTPSTDLTVREIKSELQERGVSFADCFDKESLLLRLQEAREQGTVRQKEPSEPDTNRKDQDSSKAASTPVKEEPLTDPKAILNEIRALKVKELREELARRNLRWAGLLEKEDLVQAVYKARIAAINFSASGKIAPGDVGDLTGEELQGEMAKTDTPLLLDAYAVWCGPCQVMQGQLKEVAKELGDQVRVAKLDTDKHPAMASSLSVAGLPTLILYNHGKEVDRIEGALMKDQLLQWVRSKL